MLPYFKTCQEVQTFVDYVGGRCKTCLLLETPEAVEIIDDSEYTGVYEILCNKCRDRVKQHLGDDDIEVGVYMFRMDKSYLAKSDNAESIVEVFKW